MIQQAHTCGDGNLVVEAVAGGGASAKDRVAAAAVLKRDIGRANRARTRAELGGVAVVLVPRCASDMRDKIWGLVERVCVRAVSKSGSSGERHAPEKAGKSWEPRAMQGNQHMHYRDESSKVQGRAKMQGKNRHVHRRGMKALRKTKQGYNANLCQAHTDRAADSGVALVRICRAA